MSVVTLFPRNIIQNKLFKGVKSELENLGCKVNLIRLDLDENEKDTFFIEKNFDKFFYKIKLSQEIKRLELEYKDVDFNRLIQSEREFSYYPHYFSDQPVSRDTKYRYMVCLFKVFESYVQDIQPDYIFSEMVTGLVDGVLYEVSKKCNVKYIGIRPSKIGRGVVFCDNLYDRPIGFNFKVEGYRENSIPTSILSNAKNHIKELRLKLERPHYMEVSQNKHKIFTLKKIKTMLNRYFLDRPKYSKYSLYQHPFLNPIRENLIKYKNKSKYIFHDRQVEELIENEDSYFLYPAHFEPEASISVRAFYNSDQLCFVKMISKILPLGATLIVKEHRGNDGFRLPIFYNEISHFPNVMIASPEFDTYKLLKKSTAILVLTGRMGWEGIVNHVPVIAFGDTFWSGSKYALRSDNIYELKSLIYKLYKGDCLLNIDEKDIVAIAAAYIDLSWRGNFVHGSKDFLTINNYHNIALAIDRITSSLTQVEGISS
jgi:hypothetical protein